MTLSANLFLNATGQFSAIGGVSTSTSTSLFATLTKTTTATLTNASSTTFVDGPSVSQGSSGIWLAVGNVNMTGTQGQVAYAKLWDGTTAIDSGVAAFNSNGFSATVSLSGVLSSPAGNLRISFVSQGGLTATLPVNNTGIGFDNTITVVRIG